MRAGICTAQQALTAEAVSIVKQAVSLARRRGHAQVTPLHVASAMLASPTSLFRRACLQSHSHPLQCKALELCFNVSLNRLPACTSSPLLGPHSPLPSFSNALVAAFKRAQAHQRRGSIENQQQPILALKIEIEQLVVSILDDPSVSRVMREAGFSSTQVKNQVEQAVPLEFTSQTPVTSQSKESTKPLILGANVSQTLPFGYFGLALSKPFDQTTSDDVMSVLDTLVNKKRNTVIVGECLASAEGVARVVMDKFERGDVPGDLRYVQLISLPLHSLRNTSKEDVEQKLVELRRLDKSYTGRGVVLYLGDLKWISEFWSSYGEQGRNYYCPIELIIMELKRLVCGIGETGRLWLMGIATFQSYMRCKTGHPSLESLWQLHPLTVPVASLSLSLNLDSNLQSQSRSNRLKGGSSWPFLGAEMNKHLTCCADCCVNFEREAQSIASGFHNKESITASTTSHTSSSLPSWLQQYKEESRINSLSNQECVSVKELCNKWNSFCSSVHKHLHIPDKIHISASASPTSSTSISSYERHPNFHQSNLSWPVICEPKQSPKEYQFWISESCDEGGESNLKMVIAETNELKPDLLSNPNSSPNSASSSEVMEDLEDHHGFKELSTENLEILCNALEKKVPWQKDVIPEIARVILQCRSGKSNYRSNLRQREEKEETWLFFSGVDFKSKEKIARELAKLIFGSQDNFVSIGLSSFSSTRADSTEESKNKRTRDELGCSYLERFGEAVNQNPHCVFFMEDLEQVDYCSRKGIKQAIESGRIRLPGGENVHLMDAIIIFSCESYSSVSRACSPPRKPKSWGNAEKEDEDEMEEKSPSVSLDLNIAIGDDSGDEFSVTDIGILESVDRKIIFKIQEL